MKLEGTYIAVGQNCKHSRPFVQHIAGLNKGFPRHKRFLSHSLEILHSLSATSASDQFAILEDRCNSFSEKKKKSNDENKSRRIQILRNC
jgi:hypothetical protein